MNAFTTALLTSFNTLADRLPSGSDKSSASHSAQLAQAHTSPANPSWLSRLLDGIHYVGNYSSPESKAFRLAVRELENYSDAELAEIGVHRSAIRHAVRHGRPDIDVPVKH